MDAFWLMAALACYALSSAGFIADRMLRASRWKRCATVLLGVGVLLHGADLIERGLQAGNLPVATFAQSLSMLAWVTALTSFVLILRLGLQVIGAFVAPGVSIALAGSYSMMHTTHLALPESLRSFWLPVHVILAVGGEALFVLAASVSLVYLVHESRLKAKRPMGQFDETLPSLEKLDRINYKLLGWGLALLSFAILSGAVWADATWGRFWSWEPRELWSLVTWLLYAALLESRLSAGWRGKRVAILTLVFFTILIGSYIGVNLVTPGKHGGTFG